MSFSKTFFIVNPAAGHGRLKDAWPSLQSKISRHIKNAAFEFTREAGHATLLTRLATEQGYELVVSVGGDGTLNECVNGFFDEEGKAVQKTILGVLPFGRGSDFARCLSFPHGSEQAIRHLTGKKWGRVDVGRISCRSFENKKISRYFINIADVGIVPHVVNESRKAPKILGARVAYIYGTLRGFWAFRPQKVIFSSNERKTGTDGRGLCNMVVANGKYFGAGMKVAPRADPTDGLFDVLIVEKMNPLRFLMNFPRIYSGKHVGLKEVHSFRTHRITVLPAGSDRPLLVEADGDTIGRIPATFEIVPRAIRFKV